MLNAWIERLARSWGHFRAPAPKIRAATLFAELRIRARAPQLYLSAGVPDTVEGRFSALVLHCYPLLHRLRVLSDEDVEAGRLASALVARLFTDVDDSMRAMGVGDASIARRVRTLGEAYAGQVKAYAEAVPDRAALAGAIQRNCARGADMGISERLAQAMLDQLSDYSDWQPGSVLQADLPPDGFVLALSADAP